MVKALEYRLDVTINVSPDSQFIGAIGATLFAGEHAAIHDACAGRIS